MDAGKRRRWGIIALLLLVLLIAGGVIGFRVAIGVLKGRVLAALGSQSEISDIRVGWTGLEVEGLKIKGRRGWPAADTLRAERIAIVPSLRSLLSQEYRVYSITVVKPYLSVLRTKDGNLQVLPSLLAGVSGDDQAEQAPASEGSAKSLSIGNIVLRDGVLEFFDATVADPPLAIRLEQVQASAREVAIPALAGKSELRLSGVLKGAHRDGTVDIAGWVEIDTRDSSLHSELRSVDMVTLQPYLIKADETRVRKGVLDLDLQSELRENRLQAPGKLTISGLELAPSGGRFATFMGVPRDAVVAFLKGKDDKIVVSFVLEGDIDDPRFSLNEALSTRAAASVAEVLGVSLGGVAKGVGGLGQRGVDAAGEALKGAARQLFGSRDTPAERNR